MRKTKKFTPNLIEKYHKLGRGKGTFSEYIPFHRVSRSDPSSIGLSHLKNWSDRKLELLSNCENDALLFAHMLPNLIDIREQIPLSYEGGLHEVKDYDIYTSNQNFLGTKQICEELGIKHPKVNGKGRSIPWTMTTDLLLTLKSPDNKPYLLAISIKPKNFILEGRSKRILEIEKTYWENRGVEWLLITPETYHPNVALTLRMTYHWAMHSKINENELRRYADILIEGSERPLYLTLNKLKEKLGDMSLTQCIFWQNVWTGNVPIDLNRGWRPHDIYQIISPHEFQQLNPILCRRSTWK